MFRLKYIPVAVLILSLISCAGPSRRDTLQMPYEDRLKLASIYIQGGQAERAVLLLEDAVVQEKGRPEAWGMLGELFWLQDDLEASSYHLKKALETGGEDPVVLNNLAWVESEKGHPEKALALADRAIALNPVPLYPYLETRVRVLMKLNRYSEAKADAHVAETLTPEYDTEMKEQLKKLLREIEKLEDGEKYDTY